MLTGKNIVLGITGGIAAYKVVEVASRLKKAGAQVHVIMTKAAAQFVTPLTFREITGNSVVVDMWDEPKQFQVEHIALATLADLFLIAPATADIIGKIANGIADDSLSTTVMATQAPVILAPAMNTNMYLNPIVQQNMAKLASLGYIIIEPAEGLLACGTVGQGRLPEPEVLVDTLTGLLVGSTSMAGLKVVVTAGPTREPLDPVRYLTNHSSGKMGYALARAAASRQANVVLISGPTQLAAPAGVLVKRVETAQEMRTAVLAEFADTDIMIKAAAVADYSPSFVSDQKLKKNEQQVTLLLEKTPDILAELGQLKTQQILVGFAAETQLVTQYAADKLIRKNLDMMVANDVTQPGAGFNADTNIVTLLFADGQQEAVPKMTKDKLAHHILEKISTLIAKQQIAK